ncbi:hypothetical protein PCANC_19550 [Puccinia coronata f. sp. avenae]|uniref:Uncharacterized protein n=1 Tax=Puccinia coronata f. sp. avenae TaxID=200324 RepID=A0A2N5TQ51_9BASI|nr:hypothetical protein PCANC_19550 [Puccinia coronata f. sp. avenae]
MVGSLGSAIIDRLQFPSSKVLTILLIASFGFCLPLSSAPMPDGSHSNAIIGHQVEAFSGRANAPNDQPSLTPSTETQSNNLPSQQSDDLSRGRSPFNSGTEDSTRGKSLPKYRSPDCTARPGGTSRPQKFRTPDRPKGRKKGRPRNRDKLMDAFRKNWIYYFKKISQKIRSTLVANAAAGNKWKIVNLDLIANITSMEIPKVILSPKTMFQGMMMNPEDDVGDMTGVLEQIVSLAPIGPLVHRTEVDLNFNLEQVIQLFFVSPRQSTTRLSSAGPEEIPHVTASSSQTGHPRTYGGAIDPLREYLVEHQPEKRKSYLRETLKQHNLEIRAPHSPQILKDAFNFWLNAALRRIHPFENMSWFSLCPFNHRGEDTGSLAPCIVTFTNGKKGMHLSDLF